MKYSIIVPIYGTEKYLRKCIDSILEQSVTDYELLLIDDGSKDQCPQICDEYAKKDPRIKVCHKENGGIVSARNAGLQMAKGDYVCYVDSDDWVSDNWLTEIDAATKDQPEMVMFGFTEVFHSRTIETKVPLSGFYDKDRLNKEVYPDLLVRKDCYRVGNIPPMAWNKVYRRSLLLVHYNRDTSIVIGEDNAFTYECIYAANSLVVINKCLYFYNRTNICSNTARQRLPISDDQVRLIRYMKQRMPWNDRVHDLACLYVIRSFVSQKTFDSVEEKCACLNAMPLDDLINEIDFKKLPIDKRIIMHMVKLKMYRSVLALYKKL